MKNRQISQNLILSVPTDAQNRRFSVKKSLKHRAYENIKKMIISNQISHEIPITELELSKTLGIGRAPIREALNLLSKDGLIQLIPNKGAILKRFSIHDLIQIYKIREVLDPLAAKQSIGRVDPSEVKKIEEKFLRKKNPSWESGEQFSQELHSLIYQSCGNQYLIEVFQSLILKIEVSRHFLWDLFARSGDLGVLERRRNEHVEIIRLLKEKDTKNIIKISKKHICNAIKDILDGYKWE